MNFREEIDGLKTRVSGFLPNIAVMSYAHLCGILSAYYYAFAPHFIVWIELTRHHCRSDVARTACYDNLVCEITEDHPGMLRAFIGNCEKSEHEQYDVYCKAITEACRNDVMEGLLVLAALENASLVFIPWMERAAENLCVADGKREYLRKHGIADIAHAEEFLRALEVERQLHKERRLLGLLYVERLLQSIWYRS